MKKLVLISAILLFSNVLVGQIKQGQRILGGQFSVDYSNERSKTVNGTKLYENDFVFSASPSFAILVSNEWAIGAGVGYHRRDRVSEVFMRDNGEIGTVENLFESYGASLYAQRYFKLSRSLFSKIQINANVNYAESEYIDYTSSRPEKSIYRSLGLSAVPGFGYFLNHNLALTLDWSALHYSYSIPAGGNDRVVHDISFDLNLGSVFFGLDYFF
jgi:hypothetical protein